MEFIDRIIKLGISIIYLIPIVLHRFLLKRTNTYPIILTYHSIKDNEIEKFEKQMILLKKITIPVNIENSNPSLKKERNSIVTLDDGFKSVYKNAIPILVKYDIPFCLFIVSGYIGHNSEWITNNNNRNYKEPLIDKNELLSLPKNLSTIGSHTKSHPKLANLSKNMVLNELLKSKQELEYLTRNSVNYFSFPYGSYDKNILEMSRGIGYKKALSNIPIMRSNSFNGFLHGRINITLNDWNIEYFLKIIGAYQWLAYAIAIKRLIKKI